MLRIRCFNKGDEETYVKIHNEGYSTQDWFGIVQKALTVKDFCTLDYDATFIAELNGEAVGIIDVKVRNNLGDIENIVVLPKYRRVGVGSALLEKAVDFLRKKGAIVVRAETPIKDKGATKFYAKNGFKLITHAYLIETQDKLRIEPYLNHQLYSYEENRFWIPCDDYMEFIKEIGIEYHVIGKFNVITKSIQRL